MDGDVTIFTDQGHKLGGVLYLSLSLSSLNELSLRLEGGGLKLAVMRCARIPRYPLMEYKLPTANIIRPGIWIIGAIFAPIKITTAPKQNMPRPRLKKAQLLFGSLANRCNQLMFVSFAELLLNRQFSSKSVRLLGVRSHL